MTYIRLLSNARSRGGRLASGITPAASGALLAILLAAQSASAQTFTTLDRFGGTNGNLPNTPLIQATNGHLYGTTLFGGANEDGVAYDITTAGRLATVANLDAPIAFSVYAGLIQGSDGNFYGTGQGGAYAEGTVVKLTSSGTLTTLYSFCAQTGCPDGSIPAAGLVQASDGNFYGTTAFGGAGNNGTVFKITPAGALTTLYSFCSLSACTDGSVPTTPLIQGNDGYLYGTTQTGGANGNYGTVFKIAYDGSFTTLYSFCSQAACADGQYALGGLVQAVDGNLYGVTFEGGSGGKGTLFQLTLGGAYTLLHTFCLQTNCTDGAEGGTPTGLIQGTDGNLYGATTSGGANGDGTLFSITTSGAFTTLYSSAVYGGTNNLGTIFSLSTGLGPFVSLQTTAGPAGASVTILGTSLSRPTSVTFNGTSATFTFVSSSEIVARVPTGATTGPVQVVMPTGTLNSNAAFIVQGKAGEPSFAPRPGSGDLLHDRRHHTDDRLGTIRGSNPRRSIGNDQSGRHRPGFCFVRRKERSLYDPLICQHPLICRHRVVARRAQEFLGAVAGNEGRTDRTQRRYFLGASRLGELAARAEHTA